MLALRHHRGRSPVRVLGYASVEGRPDAGLNGAFKAQMEKIAAECDRRGLSLLELVRERGPQQGSGLERPGLGYALQRISAGEAQGLVVAELSRLTRSPPDLGRLLESLRRSDARLVAAAEGLDTGEARGQLAARMLVGRGKGWRGVADYPELKERIAHMHAEGMTLRQIADRLNADGMPTVRGGAEWRPSSLQAAIGYRRPRARAEVK